MAVDVDYYQVLDVPRTAKPPDIEAAVKKAMREWRKRTEAPDLSSRQEAEVKVKQIEEARSILLDTAKRAQYDTELAAGVRETGAPASQVDSGNGQTWLERAESYLAVGDYRSAAYAAREATHLEGSNAKTWWIRSRANAGLQSWQDALYEGKQAVQLDDINPDYHFSLGVIHEEMKSWDPAIIEYRRAGSLDPSNTLYELSVGGVFAERGRPQEALPIIQAVYEKDPQDKNANFYLGSVLIDLAERVPAKRNRTSYVVTSKEEIDGMRTLASRAKGLAIVDPDVRKQADHILAYLADMETTTFRPPWQWVATAGGVAAGAGCYGAFLGGLFILGVVLLPVILLIVGFANVSSNPGFGILCLLASFVLGFIWFRVSFIPKWKLNRRNA